MVQVDVKPENIQEFISETKKSQEQSLKEDGCIEYIIQQSITDDTKFSLCEIYTSEESIEFHKKTEHFLSWRENVQPMMARPRTSTKIGTKVDTSLNPNFRIC